MNNKEQIVIAKIEFCDTVDKKEKLENIIIEISFSLNISVQDATNMMDKLKKMCDNDSVKMSLFAESITKLACTTIQPNFNFIPIKNSVNPNERHYQKRKW